MLILVLLQALLRSLFASRLSSVLKQKTKQLTYATHTIYMHQGSKSNFSLLTEMTRHARMSGASTQFGQKTIPWKKD